MTRTILLIFAGAAVLAACNRDDQTIVTEPGGRDPMAEELANAGPVELPPAIQASRIYRCRDNSLVYIDWLSDGSAQYRPDHDGAPTVLRAEEAGQPLTGNGVSLTGNAQARSITISRPNRGSQTCDA